LPPLRRFIPIGRCYRAFRTGLASVLSRLRPSGTGLSLLYRNLSSFSGTAEPRGAGPHVPFPLVELLFPGVDGPVPGLSHPVPLISDLIPPVSNEVALLSGPRALVVA
jgi:hypothetical protein